MTTEQEQHEQQEQLEGARTRKAELCHLVVDMMKNEGLNPFETVEILLSSAASVTLVSSTSERSDFERLAGEIFVHFANANDDIRGRR